MKLNQELKYVLGLRFKNSREIKKLTRTYIQLVTLKQLYWEIGDYFVKHHKVICGAELFSGTLEKQLTQIITKLKFSFFL